MSKTRNRRAIQAILVVVLLIAVVGMGTLAYLTATQSGNSALVNTFIAAGGGYLVDPTDPINPTPDVDDEIKDLVKDGFYLLESPATYSDGFYTLDASAKKVLKNTYDKVMAGMTIPKDPKLTVNLADGAEAYVFIKVTDTTATGLSYSIDSANWTKVEGLTLNTGETVYVYNGGAAVLGDKDTVELNEVNILTGEKVTAADDLDTSNAELGQLKIEAYLCQAGGFTSAAQAFNACF